MADPRSRSPFPGMDSYLEQYWGDVHHRLCTYSCGLLRRGLPPGLIARIDKRTMQRELLSGDVNLVEIDLIRSGPWVLRVAEDKIPDPPLSPEDQDWARGWFDSRPKA